MSTSCSGELKRGGDLVFKSTDIAKLCENNTFIKDILTAWNFFKNSQEHNTMQKNDHMEQL